MKRASPAIGLYESPGIWKLITTASLDAIVTTISVTEDKEEAF
jgi:hypothetical protein